eukprot:TRINITY_DN4306_c0_g2_i1.p1 TRINITY_DN4306_c0_g2~~TRINITY_DN4306_c0_g2_i1.p1  ORF type:complete len:406 (-),score=63.07 TRINITY_DN4306_c0_g2_i1:194-1411(-)
MKLLRKITLPDKWLIHSYYTLCPYAPDNSGRLLIAGADLKSRMGKIFIIGVNGEVLDEFGEHPVDSGFFHTGFWQTWSPDCRYVYFQNGSMAEPLITRRELATGKELHISGDAEGAPPDGEPIVSCLMGMLYAAGYGYGVYNPSISPAPFENRDEHGVFEYTFEPQSRKLRLSVNVILQLHPDKDKLLELDKELSARNGTPAGLTLMAYCVRWSQQAERFVFYFGNHCVVKERGEPRIANLFTCKRDFSDLRLTLDMSSTRGVHWSWHPDGEHLVGYGMPPDNPDPSKGACISMIHRDGFGYRKLCSQFGGGHPTVSPANHCLALTDNGEEVILWDTVEDKCIDLERFPNRNLNRKDAPIVGCERNEFRVCHHPVFDRDGGRFLFNVLDGEYASLYEAEVPEEYQ